MKLIISLFLLLTFVHSDDEYELQLYEKVIPSLFTHTTPLKVYPDTKSHDIIRHSKVFDIVLTCKDADFLMGKNFTTISEHCQNKPIFTTSYSSFKNQKNSFATFYWRKGRPQIKFKRSVIKKFNLTLPLELEKYAF